MKLTENQSSSAKILKNLLVFFFLYGAVSYSLSLAEYTFFHLSGKALFGVERSHESLSREKMIEELHLCGGPLFGANTIETENALDPIVARCGRFWPFYHYSVILPANNMIPGAFIKNPEEPAEVTEAKHHLIRNTTVVNLAFLLLSVIVTGLAGFSAYQFIVKKQDEKGFKWAFHAFVSSLFMMVAFVGIMFFVDPVFSLGW
ncbi:MAG: hypothetical protein CSB48_10855 [Proteobacteria bacterium]|nr:MAG: hypothetical protein CSB48_10855 [Pseudomonadota bacterium]PIE40042.1 MAG: hypothetical protein CSA51_02620 [Gammaproteobacteria bacterium]